MLPTARILGFIELLAATAESESSDATLLGTLRVMAEESGPWLVRSSSSLGRPTSDETLLCDREHLVTQLEQEFWRLEAQLETVSSR